MGYRQLDYALARGGWETSLRGISVTVAPNQGVQSWDNDPLYDPIDEKVVSRDDSPSTPKTVIVCLVEMDYIALDPKFRYQTNRGV